MKTPTEELYFGLQQIFQHFNQTLFEGALPPVLFTTQRQKGVMGYFSPNRWTSDKGKQCHEIAINPAYVGKSSIIEMMQTLVHEMVHCWQHCYGKPSQRTYHNMQWANKMIAIGLIPSSTGKPGGNITGQKMSDYPQKEGQFIQECVTLIQKKRFSMPWFDKLSKERALNPATLDALEGVDDALVHQLTASMDSVFELALEPVKPNTHKTKVKYTCLGCGMNLWGKALLSIQCNPCNLTLEQMS